MSNTVKIGLVGLGRAGDGMHVTALKERTDMFTVVAACDLIEDRLEKVKAATGCRTYKTVEELLADEEVELVVIATRSCDHYRHAVMAMEAGKHVFLEKPITLSAEEAIDLFERSEKPGAPLFFPQQNRRFEGVFMDLENVIASGKLGNVFEITITEKGYQRRDDWQTIDEFGGGQLFNWGPHIVDQSLRLLGAPVAQQFSHRVHAVAGGDCEDHFSAHFIGENGRKVNMSISGASALDTGRHYLAHGTRGSYEATNMHVHVKYIDPEQVLPRVISDPGTPMNGFGASGTFTAVVTPNWIEEEYDLTQDIRVLWKHMYDVLRNGAEYPIKKENVIALMQALCKIKKDSPLQDFVD